MSHAFIGQTVGYRLREDEAEATNRRRDDAATNIHAMRANRLGYQAHVGNPVKAGEVVPLIVTTVWADSINGQAILDGNDSLWVTSVHEGDQPGEWHLTPHG